MMPWSLLHRCFITATALLALVSAAHAQTPPIAPTRRDNAPENRGKADKRPDSNEVQAAFVSIQCANALDSQWLSNRVLIRDSLREK